MICSTEKRRSASCMSAKCPLNSLKFVFVDPYLDERTVRLTKSRRRRGSGRARRKATRSAKAPIRLEGNALCGSNRRGWRFRQKPPCPRLNCAPKRRRQRVTITTLHKGAVALPQGCNPDATQTAAQLQTTGARPTHKAALATHMQAAMRASPARGHPGQASDTIRHPSASRQTTAKAVRHRSGYANVQRAAGAESVGLKSK